jgi:hypothetical protein
MQVYATPKNYFTAPPTIDPVLNESTLFISWVNNESGHLVGYGYLLNATTEGSLNYTATPSSSGLSVSTGDSGLNATVTLFSATERGYSVSQVSNVTVDAMQTVNFTALYTMSVVPAENAVNRGCSLPINVTITNSRAYAETFNMTVYANNTATANPTVLATFTNVTVGAGNSTTLTLTMDTVGFPPGDYTINAYTTPVPGEIGTTYNTYAGSKVTIQATSGGSGGRMPYMD